MIDDDDEDLKAILRSLTKVDSEPPEGDSEIDESLFPVEPVGRVYGPAAAEQVERILVGVPSALRIVVEELMTTASVEYVDVLLAPRKSNTGTIIKNPRANYVRDLILQKGWTTTEEVSKRYDARAIDDLRAHGVTLKTSRVIGETGKSTTRYEFDPDKFTKIRDGRDPLSRRELEILITTRNCCEFCRDTDNLQGDHRVPWRIAGNTLYRTEGLTAFMLLCPSHNTKKDDVCTKKCPNNDPEVCRSCRWAYPNNYNHVATKHYLVGEFRAEQGTLGARLIQEFKQKWQSVGL